ncbi:SRPBCC family protein [Mycolicibacterium pyrenivorans]|uniref:SRPBCC family protein n=1 Tax=Mycolicibacterium pyrenivorans TaxID=187102 RepID=UPI0021F2B1ED|nr:SRPBCC family protein [Mycolicibacterium pyrenivorans]MCV7153853.1 SRPBCC family protein [Mycolicibacterium pyrenivorans]
MAPSAAPDARASVTIAADPAAVYALITDLPTLASLAEETETMQWRKGRAATPGAVFSGRNRNGSRTWTTKCTVTDAEAGTTFAFDVRSAGIVPIAHWRYDIEPTGGGCTVTESTWDRRPRWILRPAALTTGITDRTAANTEHIRLTLQRLKERAEGRHEPR